MNIRGQTGLDEAKQLQIESFIKSNRIDILNCQEINIDDNSFNNCDFISSSYEIITNNARNKYGTCCILANDLGYENVKVDTNGRVIAFNIGNITFCNVYLPSGNDPLIRNSRENYAAEIIPQILINSKDMGCIGGDWNSIGKALPDVVGQKCNVSHPALYYQRCALFSPRNYSPVCAGAFSFPSNIGRFQDSWRPLYSASFIHDKNLRILHAEGVQEAAEALQ